VADRSGRLARLTTPCSEGRSSECGERGARRDLFGAGLYGARVDLESLLSRGMFPRELPTAFSSADFASKRGRLNSDSKEKRWRAPAVFNLARPGDLRRRLSIPNPFSQVALARACQDNWAELQLHFERSSISLSKPRAQGTGRAIGLSKGYRTLAAERASRMTRGKYVVLADISQFYRSIYTHSIEWALEEKASVKRRITSGGASKSLGTLLDSAVRYGQEGQTKGIPLGPDTSIVLSEIILTAVDAQLQDRIVDAGRFALRLIDDFECYTRSRGEAEQVLLTWESLLNAFDLDINPSKTRIVEGPMLPEEPWRTRVAQFQLRTASDHVFVNDMRSFFTVAFELARNHPTQPVLSYSIRRIASDCDTQERWSAFEQLLLTAATVEPSCLRSVHDILGWADQMSGLDLNKSLIAETLNDLCRFHAPLENGAEVVWSLTILRALDLIVDSDAARAIAKMEDNCSLLLLRDLFGLSLVGGQALDWDPVVHRAEAAEALDNSDWLLAYEFIRNGWADQSALTDQAHWRDALLVDIGFFESWARAGKPMSRWGALVAGRLPGVALSRGYE